jgi:hypothetical protein
MRSTKRGADTKNSWQKAEVRCRRRNASCTHLLVVCLPLEYLQRPQGCQPQVINVGSALADDTDRQGLFVGQEINRISQANQGLDPSAVDPSPPLCSSW